MIGKPKRMGKTIDEIEEGETLSVTEIIEDRDLLLYLGLTNDNNPLYIQHDYADSTEYEGPIVPPVLLTGIMTSTISKHFPGPGSHVVNISANFILPVYHEETITFDFEVIRVDTMKEIVTIQIEGKNQSEDRVLDAVMLVQPPKLKEESVEGEQLDGTK